MKPKASDYAAVIDQMEKSALDLTAAAGSAWDALQESLLLGLGLPIGIGLAGAKLTSHLSSPGKTDYQKLRDTEMLTVLNRLSEQAEQRARQLRGEQD